jgi:catechol 2,3-dioxygenase-like lactoylglutathione lyase family enzyme
MKGMAAMLGRSEAMGFLATTNPEVARNFYESVLGLNLIEQGPFALVFSAGAITLRVQKVQEVAPHTFTAFGWRVADVASVVRDLAASGVVCAQYGLPGQDTDGIWTAPNGDRVAWFRDPDGNLLYLLELDQDEI